MHYKIVICINPNWGQDMIQSLVVILFLAAGCMNQTNSKSFEQVCDVAKEFN
jgi:hypothetical protein